jgi:prepilin-type N-terminal cleavage/methylation domain-containing protein
MDMIREILKNRDGITLLEVLVTLVISSILIAGTSMLIISGSNLFSHTATRNQDDLLAKSILNVVGGQLIYAASVQALPPSTNLQALLQEDGTVIYVGDHLGDLATGPGRLWFKQNDQASGTSVMLFGEIVYHGRYISLNYRVDQVKLNHEKAVSLTVQVYDQNGEMTCERSRSLNLMNAVTSGELLEGDTDGEKIQSMAPPRPADMGSYPATAGQPLILSIREIAP